MSRFGRLRLAAAALVASGSALLFVPTAATAASVVQSGWWYRATTTTPTAEAPAAIPGGNPTVPTLPVGPPSVSADQLHVEGTPEGATAIAAVRFALSEGESLPVLTVSAAPGSSVPPDAVILACRAAVEWPPPSASPGTWEEKPLVDCSTSVQGQVDAAAMTVVFPLQPLASGSDLDIVIVPGTVAALPAEANGSSFSLTFAKPTAADLKTTTAPPTTEFHTDFESSFEAPSSDTPFTPDDSFVAPVASPTFDATIVAPTPAVVQPALEPQDQAPSVPRTFTPAVSAEEVNTAAKKLGLMLIAVGIIAAYMTSAQRPATELGLGRFRRVREGATPEAGAGERFEGGIGRLRRERVGRAPGL